MHTSPRLVIVLTAAKSSSSNTESCIAISYDWVLCIMRYYSIVFLNALQVSGKLMVVY
jgi:hypothetical protein